MSEEKTITVDGMTYRLPTKPEEHWKPETLSVPLSYPAPKPPVNGPPKIVSVSALAGKDLTPLDYHGWSKPSSDPYVKLFFKRDVGMTDVTEKSLNPTFTSKPFYLGQVAPDDNAILEVQYWDYDKVTYDDFGGAALASIAGLLAETKGHSGQVWVKLSPSDSQLKSKKKITGEILLGIRVE